MHSDVSIALHVKDDPVLESGFLFSNHNNQPQFLDPQDGNLCLVACLGRGKCFLASGGHAALVLAVANWKLSCLELCRCAQLHFLGVGSCTLRVAMCWQRLLALQSQHSSRRYN